MNKKNVLITGSSSGLGLSLVDVFLANGYNVFGISRSKTPRQITIAMADFSRQEEIESSLNNIINGEEFDYIFLNAGTLEPIEKASRIKIEDITNGFQVNVGSSSQILNFLLKGVVKNVIAISSGASEKAYDGWMMYCVTKAALRQMISCYALENSETHFLSLAPGIIKTKMQDYIKSLNASDFDSLGKFHKLYDNLPSSDEVALKIYDNLDLLKKKESGSFFDLRCIK